MEKENQMKNEQIDEKNEILIEQIFYDREIEIPFMNKRSSVDSQNFEEKQLRNNILGTHKFNVEDQSMIDEKNFSHNLDYLSEDDSKIFTVNF